MDKKWLNLTSEEKLAERSALFFNPPKVTFDSPRAEAAYQERARRLMNAARVVEPDRVPVILPIGNFPAYYAGKSLHQVMYDYDALRQAYLKFMKDFDQDMDTFMGPMLTYPGRVLEMLDIQLFNWPGRGLGLDATTYQYLEAELMKPDEYDALICDPGDFLLRKFLPRAMGALEPLKDFVSLSSLLIRPLGISNPFASPDIRRAFQSLMNAGVEQEKWLASVLRFGKEAIAAGFPAMRGGHCFAPFDIIGDSLRGTRGILTDLFRRPDKLLAALDVVADLSITRVVEATNKSGGFMVTFPLHKGDDSHMSLKQFETFYWPSLRKVVAGLIDEGIMVTLFAEGRYGSRLAAINDFPKGFVIWHFDQTDMKEAKKVLGGNCCIMGNVPSSLMATAQAEAVRQYCCELIETCASGGGFILAGGCSTTESKEENLRAMMQAARAHSCNR